MTAALHCLLWFEDPVGILLQIPGNVAADVAETLSSPAVFFLWLNVPADFGA